MQEKSGYPEVEPFQAGLRGRCPRCGQGKLFKGFLSLEESCSSCGLDFDFADSGDGPAVFVMFIVGFIVVALVFWVEFSFRPPIWLHIVIWFPLTVLLAAGSLRPLKGAMIALQYRHSAREGRLDENGPGD